MALTSKIYTSVHSKTGDDKAKLQANFDEGHINVFTDLAENGTSPEFGALIYQIQQMQDELDYLRTEISSNKNKASFPGLGTSGSTALAGDTTTISTAQASAITANTAKTSMVIGSKATQAMAGSTALLALGTSRTTALAGDTNIVTIGSSTTIAFGDMITVPAKGKTPASYSIVMTVTNGGVSKATTLTLT
tara:strand:- start:5101 stop:5676 length:576 start_codon:yes stop_codon:yes gene_type:complete